MYAVVQVIYLIACIKQLCQAGFVKGTEDEKLENQIVINSGSNVTLPCTSDITYVKTGVYWVRKGIPSDGEKVLDDGSLFLSNLKKSDTTQYMCYDEKNDHLLSSASLYVKGPPDQPTNASVVTTIEHALIKWEQEVNPEWEQKMGGAITSIHMRYRKFTDSDWYYFPHHIPPSEGEVNVYMLEPNSNYEFEIWSQNKYGSSSHVPISAKTLSIADMMDYNPPMMAPPINLNVDAKAWLTALVSILFVINMFALFMIAMYCRKGRSKPMEEIDEYSENIELVPNIIENPVCNVDQMLYEESNQRLMQSGSKLPLSDPSNSNGDL